MFLTQLIYQHLQPHYSELQVLVIFGSFLFLMLMKVKQVYTDPVDFSVNNQSIPSFSHHKLTCFEYADGVNKLIDSI